MNRRSVLTGALGFLISSIFVLTALAAGRPARQNANYNPAAAAQFPSVTTGVAAKINSASIAKDGTITCRFTVTDSAGHGLDVNGVQTAGSLSLRFVAAYIPNGQTQYVAYTITTLKASINSNPAQVQAGTDSGGKFTLIDATTGAYDYTFATKAPATFDAAATHTIGMQAERNLSAYGISEVASDDAVYNFVPNGSPVTAVRDVVSEASCNNCHNPISAHGGGRKKMAYCVLCHTPQSTNPDTQNTVDMAV